MTNPVYSAPLDLITTAVLDLFKSTGRATYDGQYTGSPTEPTYPYHILYRIPGGNSDVTPDLAMTLQTVTVAYQLTTVSNRRNQCENAAGAARDRFLARDRDGWIYPLAMPTGWLDAGRRPDPAMPGIDTSGNEPTAVYSLPARFYLTITPA